MDLLDLLPPEHVIIPLAVPDLRTAIDRLLDRLEEHGAARPSPPLRQRIRTEALREIAVLNDDVVVPHYRSEAADSVVLAMGVSPDPIPPGDTDLESRPRIVALILAPPEAASLYLQITSTLARLLRDPDAVGRIVELPDADALRAMPELRGLRVRPSLSVRDVMTHRVASVPPRTTVRSTLQLMLRRRLHAVPVVGEKGEVLGMVTEADMMRTLLPTIPRAGSDEDASGDQPLDRPVGDIMTRSVLCVSEDLGVSEVASMMINKDVEQVPVVQAGTITGIVSRGNIIRKLFGRA